MQDTIIKGTGNSRTLGSVPNFLTLYPTYEAFGQALVNKQLPIDLGPLNAAGVSQKGDDLNKANLLKDSTAALYGLGAEVVPDQVLAQARKLITAAQNAAGARGDCFIEYGSYAGAGVLSKSLTFTRTPYVVFISANTVPPGHAFLGLYVRNASAMQADGNYVSYDLGKWNGNSLEFQRMNFADYTYLYVALTK